jgi:hypothetical protein
MISEENFRWLMFLFLCFLLGFFVHSCNAYGDQVTVEGNKITIVGDKAFDDKAWEARQIKAKGLVEAEIKRRHELKLEVAKFKNALMLERAGAPNISVRAYASNRTNVQQVGKNSKVINKIKR